MHAKMGGKFEILAFHHPIWSFFSPFPQMKTQNPQQHLEQSSGCSGCAALVIRGWVVQVESNAGGPGCVTGLLPAAPV